MNDGNGRYLETITYIERFFCSVVSHLAFLYYCVI